MLFVVLGEVAFHPELSIFFGHYHQLSFYIQSRQKETTFGSDVGPKRSFPWGKDSVHRTRLDGLVIEAGIFQSKILHEGWLY